MMQFQTKAAANKKLFIVFFLVKPQILERIVVNLVRYLLSFLSLPPSFTSSRLLVLIFYLGCRSLDPIRNPFWKRERERKSRESAHVLVLFICKYLFLCLCPVRVSVSFFGLECYPPLTLVSRKTDVTLQLASMHAMLIFAIQFGHVPEFTVVA